MSAGDEASRQDAVVRQLHLAPEREPRALPSGDGASPPAGPPPAAPSRPWDEPPERKNVIPPWLRDRAQRRAALRWLLTHHGHLAAFHSLRLPLYAVIITGRVPFGAGRCLHHAWAWAFDREAHDLRLSAVQARDAKQYAQLARIRRDRVRHRLSALAAAAIASAVTVTLLTLAWHPAPFALGAVVLLALGIAGRPRGKPLFEPAALAPQATRLTADIVTRALGTLGISEINKWLRESRDVPMWIGRDGPGWRADVDLPPGVTATMIMDKRSELASGLRRAVGCVWPEPSLDQHAGRLVLYVADAAMSQAKQAPWPLARHGKGDIFRPLPFGTDQRGRVVTITLIFESMLIGAIPRAGKTGAMRVIALGAALDPSCEMHVFDLKGTGDLSALELVAHRYASGADEDTLTACMDSLREVHGYLATRSKTISGLPSDQCPDRKVTPELSARRSLSLHPVGLLVDEVQEIFESDYAKEAEALCLALLKRGPAMGIFLVMATQRPDARSLPKSISANAGVRFCLRIVDEPSNNMILGAGMYAAGYRATMFTVKDKGVGWLAGQAEDPQVTRTFYMDAPAADKIAARARALREAAGTLTGQAADDAPPDVSLLRDVLEVMPEDRLWLSTIAGRLAELRPLLYSGWDAAQLGSALRPFGVIPRQQWHEDSNKNGISRADVLDGLGTQR
jgi:DNA segregation ATPase FtsK/SpoIIIE, S-DNA-T family